MVIQTMDMVHVLIMKLVNEDIKLNKEQYNIDVIDKNIDFRRVDNLIVFFKNNAISLTLDVNDIDSSC